MGFLDKEAYERKREWAAKRMEENTEIETLNEEQHEILAKLCQLRHELHTNWDSVFNNNYDDVNYFCDDIDDNISDQLASVGLPRLKLLSSQKLVTVDDFDLLMDDELQEYEEIAENSNYDSAYDAWREDEYEKCCGWLNETNNNVESYLKAIDDEHGTSYCPSGSTRIY